MFNQNNVNKLKIPRSYKNIKPVVTTTFNVGEMVPFFNMEIIPNDRITLDIKSVTNMQTPNYATMDTLYQSVAFFYCPNRLVWENWDKFYGDGKTNDYETFVQKFVPQLTCPSGGWAVGSIADYLGVVTGRNCHKVSALPFRMIAMIYNEYYRDEQRQAKVLVSKGDSDQTGSNGYDYVNDLQNGGMTPRTCRLYDYFTGTKLQIQAGDPVTIPIGTSAPVYTGTDNATTLVGNGIGVKILTENGGAVDQYKEISTGEGNLTVSSDTASGASGQIVFQNLKADLSRADGITVQEFKKLLMAQQVLMNIETAGSRYIEQLYRRWGVRANELELEIPKFLGSRTTILNMNMVVGTGAKPTSGTSNYDFGALTGMSNTFDGGHIFTYHFKQHGYLFGIVTIRPQNTYEDGIPKQLVKHSIDDYYKPEYAYLGAEEVKNYEIYSDASDNKDDLMFGIRNYGDDLRYIPNRITGQMRATSQYSQNFKTYSIHYNSRPLNNSNFIRQDQTAIDKTLVNPESVTHMHQFTFQCQLDIKMTRNLPANGNIDELIRL